MSTNEIFNKIKNGEIHVNTTTLAAVWAMTGLVPEIAALGIPLLILKALEIKKNHNKANKFKGLME